MEESSLQGSLVVENLLDDKQVDRLARVDNIPRSVHLKYGQLAEALAADYLLKLGYEIYRRNYRCPEGEIDIIAWDQERVLCFIEVRARSDLEHGDPLETINRLKIRRIIKAAYDFLDNLEAPFNPYPEMRFDVVGVLLGEPLVINLVRGAFEA